MFQTLNNSNLYHKFLRLTDWFTAPQSMGCVLSHLNISGLETMWSSRPKHLLHVVHCNHQHIYHIHPASSVFYQKNPILFLLHTAALFCSSFKQYHSKFNSSAVSGARSARGSVIIRISYTEGNNSQLAEVAGMINCFLKVALTTYAVYFPGIL